MGAHGDHQRDTTGGKAKNWHRQTAVKAYRDISKIIEVIEKRQFMPDEVIQQILERTRSLQEKAGFNGDYEAWVEKNTPPRLENLLGLIH